jgi:hypothetical protein
MRNINEYIVNEGLKDSFINVFNNFFNHGEVSNKKLVTIEIDPKVFGKFVRDKEYFKYTNKEYPKLVPNRDYTVDDLWELHKCELGEDKYGNETTIFTYVGHADFRKNKNVIEVQEEYKDLVEKVIEKYK